ncbi:MAG: VOC family protein [Thermoleophilia bacterium]|nr:VOC family protein [Thermoleophilia bacterium]
MPERTGYAPGTPSWVDLASTDVDAAKKFYGEVFGWDFHDMPTDQGGSYTMATKGGKAVAGIMSQPPMMAEQGLPSAWNTYVTVASCDDCVAEAQDAGGAVAMPPMDVMDAGRMAVVTDTTGAACCLWEPNSSIGAEVVNEHGAWSWASLMTDDQSSASDFYSKLFGWQAKAEQMPDGNALTLYTLQGAPVAAAVDAGSGDDMAPNHWHNYFAVDDCDACVQAIKDAGGAAHSEPMDVPPGRVAAVSDPTGAAFSVIQLNPDFDPTAM